MATAPLDPQPAAPGLRIAPRGLHQLSDTTPFKRIPPLRSDREQIRAQARALVERLDKSRPLARQAIEAHARALLLGLGLPEIFLGWTMVVVATAFWTEQVQMIPPNRRLLLLPHCLRSTDACPAKYDEHGLLCEDCGACALGDLRKEARRLGYQVLIAEGSPIVMQMILRGEADAILGAACLNSLEKALDKILLAGIPCMAVPLLTNSCRDTTTDEDWVREMIATPYRPGVSKTRTYVHLLRAATGMFEVERLGRLVSWSRGGPTLAQANGQGLAGISPVAATEAMAHDFILRGGKHFRPFITLAAYDAMTGGSAAGPDGAGFAAGMPDAVKRVALAIEVFHKASLVHDDIEDDDAFRYGQPALHRKYGPATAINVGDYLIGLGYRMVAQQREELEAEAVAEVLAKLAEAHTRLCEGQGAELAWRDARDKRLAPLEALKIYALKTAPAFEAALFAGIRLAGPAAPLAAQASRFSRHLGVAFQILNDLDDWHEHQPNKRAAGMDALAGRPTVLWAMALENLDSAGRQKLANLVNTPSDDDSARLKRVGALYQQADVFQRASKLVDKQRHRAHEVAEAVQPEALRHLLHYLADTILQ